MLRASEPSAALALPLEEADATTSEGVIEEGLGVQCVAGSRRRRRRSQTNNIAKEMSEQIPRMIPMMAPAGSVFLCASSFEFIVGIELPMIMVPDLTDDQDMAV